MPKSSNPLGRFNLATDEVRKRIIAASAGEVGTGKTHFWLTAPAPIVMFSLDKGTEGVVEPFVAAGKEIYIQEYEWEPTDQTPQDEAIDIRDKFIEEFEYAVQHARTVIWDKEHDVWELFRYAEFGAPEDKGRTGGQAAPRDYPALNQRYRKYVNMPKSFDINFGLIRGMKDQWGSAAKAGGGTRPVNTGNRVVQGFNELEGLMHVSLFHRREEGKFIIDVSKSRGPGGQQIQDTSLEGMSGPGLTFPEFAQLVFPDTDESDWE